MNQQLYQVKSVMFKFLQFFVLSVFCLTATSAFANDVTGKVTGTVVDSETGEPLIGANVFFEGTNIGAASDLDGQFTIKKIPPGTYNLIVSMIGYAKLTVSQVKVDAGETLSYDLSLKPEAIMAEDVVVVAEIIENTEAALLKKRQKSIAISDAISAEAISRSGSGDAAEAMTKVTGASVVDGKYVYIRGLGERYASTHLNGVELPSADPDKKAFQLDLFPANLLDNIVTLKTFTPDKPGNFSGGVVDIGTKAFPEQFTMSFSSSASYNSQATWSDKFLLYSRGSTDWLAIEDGTRDIPDMLSDPGLTIPSPARARIEARRGNIADAQFLDAASKSFNSIMGPTSESAPVNQSYGFSVGNQRPFFGKPLGYVFSLTYGRSLSYYEDGFTGRYSLPQAGGTGLNSELLLEDTKGEEDVNWGGVLNLGYKLTPHHELSFNSIYSRSAESEGRYQFGTWPKEFGLSDNTNFFENRTLIYKERELYSLQVSGEHFLKGLLNSTVEWNASMAANEQEEPDSRFFANIMRVSDGDTSYSASQSGFSDPGRYFRNLQEDSRNAKLDISIPFKQWSGLKSKFKIGGAYKDTEREFRERIFSISPSSTMPYTGDPQEFFSNERMGIIAVDTLANGNPNYTFGNTVAERSKVKNNYDGSLDVGGVYGMLDVPLASRLRFIGGVRYETTELETVSQDTNQAIGRIKEQDILPSANLVFSLKDNMNVRAAYTKTLARPTLREIAPFESFEFINGNFLIGNPALNRALIDNYDLRWEWFLRPGEIVAVSAFYKNISNPIERTIVGGTNGQIQYKNVDDAEVFGLEFEVRKRFDDLGGVLEHFSAGANFTLTDANITIPEDELVRRRAVDPDANDVRPLQGQSPFLLNVDLSYINSRSRTTLSVSYNTFGDRLSNVSLGGTPDVFERTRHTLSFNARQGLFRHLSLKFAVKNILNDSYKESYELKGNEFIYQEYKLGRTYSFGVSYSL